MQAWATTRNTYEAAALAALDIPVRPVTMRDFKSGTEYTDWNLAPNNQSVVDGEIVPERNARLFVTADLRRDYNNGQIIGALATQPLHPYLIAVRAMHNRARLIEAQRGKAMHLQQEAPGSWILQPGAGSVRSGIAYIDTPDQDLTLALIGIGCELLSSTHNGTAHVYRVARYAHPVGDAPAIDGGTLMQALRANELFPARRWEPFAISIHALHCLRELRKHQHSTRFITIKHKTYQVKGAAFRESATSAVQAAVQNKLGIKL